MKVLFSLYILTFVIVFGQDDSYYGAPETPCNEKGGLCILKTQCGYLKDKDVELCPKQASKGFGCCLELPRGEYRCKRFGGDCVLASDCNYAFRGAKDCPTKQVCCNLRALDEEDLTP